MSKAIISSVLCLLTFTGCHRSSNQVFRKVQTPDDQETGVVPKNADPVITDLDTSMYSLKTAARVSLDDLLSQLWKLGDADQPHWNSIFWDSAADARAYPELALFSDHNMTENARCNIKTGKWALDKARRELRLRFSDGTAKIYTIRQIALKKMEVGWGQGGDTAVIKMSAGAIVHKRLLDDPFYPANNQWRVKPNTPESDAQIHRRVRGCVHFFSLFFQDNHLRQATELIFTGLPSCFLWYNGGIGIQDRLDLDKKWTGCFYSEAQALEGYKLLESILASHTLKWPEHPTSWINQTGDVLQQMADKL